jgi:hypothetical protein
MLLSRAFLPAIVLSALSLTSNIACATEKGNLLEQSQTHQRFFLAAFDCDWTGVENGPKEKTNVWQINQQIIALDKTTQARIKSGYVLTRCPEEIILSALDESKPRLDFTEKLEKMYGQLAAQSVIWLKADPSAEIIVVSLGFSLGAQQSAAFARLVHERGLQEPKGKSESKDRSGIAKIEFTEPALVKPGVTFQAVGLFDPVGIVQYDLNLPVSVVSGIQITAKHEHRDLFASLSIIKQGMSENKQLLGVTLPGAHADVGGGYSLNGLSIRSGNLMRSFLNRLFDRPYLPLEAEPSGQDMNVIHRSEEERYPSTLEKKAKAKFGK